MTQPTQAGPALSDEPSDLPSLPRRRGCPFDPDPAYARLREEQPVSRIAFPSGGSGWLVTRWADARAVLADPAFSSRLSTGSPHVRRTLVPLPEQALPGALLRLDGAEHRRYRRPVMRAFTVRRVQQLRPRIERIVEEHLAAMERAAAAGGGAPVDLVAELALPVTSLVICELLGVRYEDRATFQRLAGQLLTIDVTPEQSVQARLELGAFLSELVAAKRLDPGADLLSTLVAEADADPEGPLNDQALTVLGSLLLIAGHETTANMISLGTLALLQHPGQLAALRAQPELGEGAVEELLRHLTIIQFGLLRLATQDTTVGGRSIRAGEQVVVALPAANRDPGLGLGLPGAGEPLTDPEHLDITRPPTAHLAFGHGPHQCLGQQLARAELQITLGALFARFPGLRLAEPLEQVPFRDDMIIYGVHRLLVTW
ncbi:cytochrome P450 [Kitasatospora sp. NBC_01302]|uniref:cytochrome P450 n=1 Tax=Kitasatospora sp. NBC_01302 TaxID=2903575 RepID=UPI002E1325AB|nr:cytochrome P450 [Kitasatospora sp. NBC_01302]